MNQLQHIDPVTAPKNASGRRKPFFQPKLSINQPNDAYEQEADHMAGKVMRMVGAPANQHPFFKPAGKAIHRKCKECALAEKQVQRKEGDGNETHEDHGLDSYVSSLNASGQPMSQSRRSFFEPKFGHDFSSVRLHTDAAAAKSAQSINALAYTSGNNIVFNTGQFSPDTDSGKTLMAHELTHVVQQSNNLRAKLIQRAPDKKDAQALADRDKAITEIRAEAAFKALDAKLKKLAEEIITEIKKRPIDKQNSYYLPQFKALFETKEKTPDEITEISKTTTDDAVKEEAVRTAKPEEAKNKDIEEATVNDPARAKAWERVPGKFGGGAYFIDRRSPTDIAIKASIKLNPIGKDAAALKDANDQIGKIKQMKDGIEKAASTQGYIVSISFVDKADADTFNVDVDMSQWEVATNWRGGSPLGFAHELHHLFAYPLDRYNYIDSQAANPEMEIGKRMGWFKTELSKPADYNDPTSIMDQAPHPNDLDVCTVAGTDMKTCMDARKKMAADATPGGTSKQFNTPDSANIGMQPRISLAVHIDFLPDHSHLHVFITKEQGGEYEEGFSRQIIGDPGKGGDYGVILSTNPAGSFIRFVVRSEKSSISVPDVKGTYTLNAN